MFFQTDTSKELDRRVIAAASSKLGSFSYSENSSMRVTIADKAVHVAGLSGDVDETGRTQASRTITGMIGTAASVKENIADPAGKATFQGLAEIVGASFKAARDGQPVDVERLRQAVQVPAEAVQAAPVATDIIETVQAGPQVIRVGGNSSASVADIETLYPSW